MRWLANLLKLPLILLVIIGFLASIYLAYTDQYNINWQTCIIFFVIIALYFWGDSLANNDNGDQSNKDNEGGHEEYEDGSEWARAEQNDDGILHGQPKDDDNEDNKDKYEDYKGYPKTHTYN